MVSKTINGYSIYFINTNKNSKKALHMIQILNNIRMWMIKSYQSLHSDAGNSGGKTQNISNLMQLSNTSNARAISCFRECP